MNLFGSLPRIGHRAVGSCPTCGSSFAPRFDRLQAALTLTGSWSLGYGLRTLDHRVAAEGQIPAAHFSDGLDAGSRLKIPQLPRQVLFTVKPHPPLAG